MQLRPEHGLGVVSPRSSSSSHQAASIQSAPRAHEPQDALQLGPTEQKELQRWKDRYREELGQLQTPPIGSGQLEAAKQLAESLLDQVAGDDFRAQGMRVRVEVFSGDIPQATLDDSKDQEELWAEKNPDKPWPIRTWYGVPHDDQPFYRLTLNAGLLRSLHSQDELGFVLAQQAERLLRHHAVDPKNEDELRPESQNILQPGEMQAGADRDAVERMVRAKLNPHAALTALERLYRSHPEEYSADDQERAMEAGAAGHEHEGLRIALVQTQVEQLKRSGEPTTLQPLKPMPEGIAPPGPALYETPVADFPRFQSNFNRLADQLLQEKTPDWMFGEGNRPPEVRYIRRTQAAGDDYQRALLGLVEHLQSSPAAPQQKVDAFLRLLVATRGDCMPEDKPFQSETLQKLGNFLSEQKGWQAEPFLSSLRRNPTGKGQSSLERSLVQELNLNPTFQAVIAPLQESGPWKTLVEKAPANYSQDPKTGQTNYSSLAQFYRRNQRDPESTWPLAQAHDQAVRQHVSQLDGPALAAQHNEQGLPVALSLSNELLSTPNQTPEEVGQLRQALQPVLKAGQEVREDHARLRLRPPLQDPQLVSGYLKGLFTSEQWGSFSSEFESQVPAMLLDIARTSSQQPDFVFADGSPQALESSHERRLCQMLNTQKSSEDAKHLTRTLSRHWRHELRVPETSPRRAWSQQLSGHLAQQPLQTLLKDLCQPDLSQHAGSLERGLKGAFQLQPQDLPDLSLETLRRLNERKEAGEFEPKRENFQTNEAYLKALSDYRKRVDSLGDAVEFLAPVESRLVLSPMAILGHDPKASLQVNSQLKPDQFAALLQSAESAQERSILLRNLGGLWDEEPVGADAGAFLMEGFVAVQGRISNLDEWYDLAKRTMDLSPGSSEARPGTKKTLGNALFPRLHKLQPEPLREWMGKEHVLQTLAAEQSSVLLAKILGKLAQPGSDLKELTAAVAGLNQDLKLQEEFPAVYHQLRDLVAEQSKLQPHNVDSVFPDDGRSSIEKVSLFSKHVRGLSSLLAISRGRPAQDQIDTVEYLMGRRKQMPEYLETASDSQSLAPITQTLRNVREELKTSDSSVRVVVANSFLAGPSGILRDPEGREAVINHFMRGISEKHHPLSRKIANAILKSQGDADTLAVAYILAQKPEPPKQGEPENPDAKMDEATILSRLFDSYGVPGIKMKQYLAFTSEFAPFREAFESAQDSALPLNYFQVLKLIQKRFGEEWPPDLKVERVLGSGSVNVAISYFNEKSQKREVVSMGREDVIETTNYDFGRFQRFIQALTETPEDKEKFGYILGLVGLIEDSVDLEFDKESVLDVQRQAYKSYSHKDDGWTVRSIDAYSVKNLGLFMEEAKGKTARKIYQQNPDLYREALRPLARAEMGILRGQDSDGNWWPKALFSNPDFHDGQVLIEEASKTVTILDFGQAVMTDNEQRETALDLLTIIGKGDSARKATKRLNKRFFDKKPVLTREEIEPILKRKDRMDCFIHLLSLLAQKGAEVPISSVHWILGVNRQIALGTKLNQSVQKQVRNMVINHKIGLPLGVYNTMHEVKEKVVGWAASLGHCLGLWALNEPAEAPAQQDWAWRPLNPPEESETPA